MSTRERIWEEIKAKHPESVARSVWAGTDVISQIPEMEWTEMHAGVCVNCSAPARLYASGWFCSEHAP